MRMAVIETNVVHTIGVDITALLNALVPAELAALLRVELNIPRGGAEGHVDLPDCVGPREVVDHSFGVSDTGVAYSIDMYKGSRLV